VRLPYPCPLSRDEKSWSTGIVPSFFRRAIPGPDIPRFRSQLRNDLGQGRCLESRSRPSSSRGNSDAQGCVVLDASRDHQGTDPNL